MTGGRHLFDIIRIENMQNKVFRILFCAQSGPQLPVYYLLLWVDKTRGLTKFCSNYCEQKKIRMNMVLTFTASNLLTRSILVI